MPSRKGRGKLSDLLARLFLGDRDFTDPEWDRAADSALTRAQDRDTRLRHLQERVEVITKR
jgi:hypothetical protein